MNAPLQQLSPRPALILSDDFDKMLRAGALDRFDRVELRDGVIYEMNPQYSEHGYLKGDLAFALREGVNRLGAPWKVGTEISLRGDDANMPAPDISVCARFEPGPIPLQVVKLLVEISDTSLDYDLGAKLTLYAGLGVSEYWVVDVKRRVIHLFSQPEGEIYAEHRQQSLDEPITAMTLDDLRIEPGWQS